MNGGAQLKFYDTTCRVNRREMSHNSVQRHETPATPDAHAQNATDLPGKATRNLRESMPLVAALIDEMREAFGAEEINAQIKLGMQGAQTFHASENGIEVGTRFADPVKYITLDKMVIREKSETLPMRGKK